MKHQRKAKHIRQKQQEKRFTWWFAAGSAVFVLLAIGGLLFWHSKQMPPEPVKVYKMTAWTSPSAQKSDTAEIPQKGSPLHTHRPDDVHHHDTVVSDVPTDTAENAPTAPIESVKNPQNFELTEAELAEVDHEVTHIQLELIKEDILALNAEMVEKYPEVAKVSSFTTEEIRKKYPTQAAQAALQAKAEQMREEFLTKIRDIMAHLPMDQKIEIIVGVSQNFADRYGDDAADEVAAQLMRTFGL